MLASLVNVVTPILDKFVPDADERNKLAHEIATMAERHAQEIALAQIEVNKVEAKGDWFRAGWRPATGWVCVLGFAVNFLVVPIASGFGLEIPQADVGTMMPVLLGMLGLGGLRTMEKTKGMK